MEAKQVVRMPKRQAMRAQLDKLVLTAQTVRRNAYAPYSKFSVGAAILTADGDVFSGCNVENASYGLSICAERSAASAMVSDGQRRVLAIAVVTQSSPPSPPCGSCRQVLAEFAPNAVVVLANTRGERQETTLGALLPQSFNKDYL